MLFALVKSSVNLAEVLVSSKTPSIHISQLVPFSLCITICVQLPVLNKAEDWKICVALPLAEA